ncbi:FtsH protease activity modulator HflK [Caldalkalibacillus mannanilyticus]|uniref:FtsH protease activity modulator HflK n=1 Tax=Caldalkalibacillus mannanilyticus TaxID=1418 RepID=UPI00046874AB|nr:FtsH protease activity modulator HflK [Caldalkalibacillus mannanilyticus]
MVSIKQIYAGVIGIIVISLLFLVATTSWYTVDSSEQAVLITLGQPDDTIVQAGLNFKLPWPIQTVRKVSRETFSLTFGYEDSNGEIIEHTKEAKMVTGDENIILADLEVQWRISDPVAFLFNTANPQNVLYNATSASLRGVIGSSKVDDALTDGRAKIMSDVRESLTHLIDQYGLGITIVEVNLQDVDLPNEEVKLAFRKVTDAREEMNTKINQAKRYENENLNVALGEKEAIISRATGQKIERIETARGDVAKFNALYQEYVNSKDITKHRLIIETLETVLPNAQIYIMDDDSGTVKYLPIQPQKGGN